jgi:hypothetical protein
MDISGMDDLINKFSFRVMALFHTSNEGQINLDDQSSCSKFS